jgi:quinol-cytochrome oxidoreductase complex cytochrome b subunit
VPFIGDFILKVLRGGPDLSALTLTRFFSAHIWMLPAALVALISTHLYMIVRLGISHIPGEDE